VDEKIKDSLIDLNRTFYQTFAQQFSATRQRLQPGVVGILEQISGQESILDLGCGNGLLGQTLFRRGHQDAYTGLDSNAELVKIAMRRLPQKEGFSFLVADLTSTTWDSLLPRDNYDYVFAFAVFHHIPGYQLRLRTLKKIAGLTRPGAHFIHSEWQFLNSPRLKARVQPWDSIGIDEQLVEEGDYLVDWRSGGHGLRYVHVFDSAEFESLAAKSGFRILDSFHSDGESGNLAIYQIWQRV